MVIALEKDIDKMIEDNIGLIHLMQRRMRLVGDEESFSMGLECLYKAALDFDPEKGFAFSTLACKYLFNRFGHYIRKLNTKKNLKVSSYNRTLLDSDGGSIELIDLIPCEHKVDDELMYSEFEQKVYEAIAKVRKTLSGVYIEIFDAWVESDFKLKQKDIVSIFNISQPHASRFFTLVRGRLKKELGGYIDV